MNHIPLSVTGCAQFVWSSFLWKNFHCMQAFVEKEHSSSGNPEYSSLLTDDTAGKKGSTVMLCEDDVLRLLADRVDEENQFHIFLSRANLLARGLKQWQRQKKGSPSTNLALLLLVRLDSSALRKEFLTGQLESSSRWPSPMFAKRVVLLLSRHWMYSKCPRMMWMSWNLSCDYAEPQGNGLWPMTCTLVR
eukprot:XP_013991137.1 PREDICTED: uncharacterized protein LOC106566963 isoform X2 [Salmo salar]